MNTTSQNMVHHKYDRDYLLQLRLHPFSLQKPGNLKSHDIVKEKLYLHQLNFGTGSQNTRLSYPDVLMPLKDSENVLRCHHSIPACFSGNCSSYLPGRKCNTGIFGKPSSKSRQLYIPDYVSSMQKLSTQNASDYEDFLHNDVYCSNAPWLKQCCSFSEETWDCRSRQSDHESSSKSSFEGQSKSKKNPLPIIDPRNGKNILDGICEVSSNSQESISSEGNDGYSETMSDSASIKQLNRDKCSFSEKNSSETENTTKDLLDIDYSSECKISGNQNPSCKDIEPKKIGEEHGNNLSEPLKTENNLLKSDMTLKEVPEKMVGDGVRMKEVVDSDYELYKRFASTSYDESKISDSFETLGENGLKDVHGDCLYQRKHTTARNKAMTVQECDLNFEDQLKMNIKQLKEKLYSIRQEQQKMAILQSFLHLKKHQLNESYQRLEDKKVEIVNREFNLANKAKRLQEKECRLEARRLSLQDKESKLDEREKMLNEYSETKPQQDGKTAEQVGEDLGEMKKSEKTFSVPNELGEVPEVKI